LFEILREFRILPGFRKDSDNLKIDKHFFQKRYRIIIVADNNPRVYSGKKIIYFSEIPFTERDIQRFGLEILKRNGFYVEIWDISRYILKDDADKVRTPGKTGWEHTLFFSTEPEILDSLSRCDRHALLIMLCDFNLNTLSIYRTISKNNLRFAVLYLNAFPAPRESYSLIHRIKNFIKNLPSSDIHHVFQTIGNELLRRYYPVFGVNPASICILGGLKALDFRNKPISSKTEKVWLHSLDYDSYLEEKGRPYEINNRQWVYIETYSRSDPDQYFCPHDRSFKPDDTFFKHIQRTFDGIEKAYDVEIVIVEHPKKLHDDAGNYGNRLCIRGNTAGVIKSSAVVLSHDSTAINFAVLFRKPIIFLTSRAIEPTDNGKKIAALAHIFGKDPVYIDDLRIPLPGTVTAVNEESYSRYIDEYITRNREELPAWEIFSDFLKRV
jgi:hypothetical protein